MIHDLKPYPAYRESSILWAGATPAHWEDARLKTYVPQVNDQTSEIPANNVYVPIEAVESWTGRVRLPKESVRFDSQVKRFMSGDVLFGKLRPYLAKVTRAATNGVCVSEFLVLRPHRHKLEPAFLATLLRSHRLIDLINSSTFGAKMPRAEWLFVGNLRIPIPPIPEQSAIVRFLDHADRRIRRYIHAKQKLIALLDEQRQAVIQRIVLRGLDPNVRLKPSGVEWLGDVPEHWEVRWAKWSFREVDERSADGAEELLSVSHLTGVTPRSAKNITMFMAESYAGHKICRQGDLVVNTMWAWMGALGVSRQTGIVSPSYAVYRPISKSDFLPDFVDTLLRLRPYVDEFKRRSTGRRKSLLRRPTHHSRLPGKRNSQRTVRRGRWRARRRH